MTTRSPQELGQPRPSVVRLNRRAIYVVGAVVIIAFVTGLIAVRAQGRRLTENSAEPRITPAPRSRPWFDGVPDQDPAPRPLTADPPPPAPTPTLPKALTADEQESERRQRVLRAAMSAPIGVAAFERRLGPDHARRRRADGEVDASNPARPVVPAGMTTT